ncbi:MAG: DUF1499 domain-containing protein [Gammaproteobacteria bacterium]|nr:DUF1499 domain-containing protein [Pseudomonadales bacterium]MCP5348583.1 DUF1499 domain-containing protein [Pseudomonadales bacterium]
MNQAQATGGGLQAGKIINIASIVAVVLGAGLALWALLAPIGVWLGMWDFRQGFTLLRNASPFALWIAGFGLLATIAGAVGLFAMQLGNSRKLTILALISTIAAGLAYSVPTAYRTTDAPPIHDITTLPDNPPEYVAIAPLRANAANSMVYGDSPNMTAQRLAELTREAYPDMVPQRFSEAADEVFDRAVSAVQQLGWELVDANRADGRIEATDTTFWFRFKDDVVIYITREGNETVLNARSLSRVGGSDFGKNAQRLRDLFALL